MFKRNGNTTIKKMDGTAFIEHVGLGGELTFSLPILRTTVEGVYKIKYKITVEKVKHHE